MAIRANVDVSAPEETKTILTFWTASTVVQNFLLSGTRATNPAVPAETKYVAVRGSDAIRTDRAISKMCARGTVVLAALLRHCKCRKARLTRRRMTNEVATFTATVVAGDVQATMTCDEEVGANRTAGIV